MKPLTLPLTIASLLLIPACRDDANTNTPAGDTDAGTGSDTGAGTHDAADESGTPGELPTFWGDVAPLYFDHCVTCHRDGGIAPFALDNPADAITWAAATKTAVTARTMPPWLVTDDGSCGEFLDSRALDQSEIDTITAWIDSERPEGAPRDDLRVPESESMEGTTAYMTPDFTPEIVGGPLAEFDEYRCFLVEPGLDRDTHLTGYEIVPGNDAIVHHVLAVVVDPEEEGASGLTNRETIEAYQAQSPDRAGWPCFSGAGDETSDKAVPVVWAPGQGPVAYPDGTGVAVAQGDMIVVQVHYNLAVPETVGTSDQTQVKLRFQDEVAHPGVMMLPDRFLETIFGGEPASLPAGQSSTEFSWEIPMAYVLPEFGTQSVKLYGVLPHMHGHGRSIQMSVTSADAEQCAVDVPAWDFNWQLLYFYAQPLTLTGDQTVRVTCDYDTSNVDEPITPGWGTQNEMCLVGMFVVPE